MTKIGPIYIYYKVECIAVSF